MSTCIPETRERLAGIVPDTRFLCSVSSVILSRFPNSGGIVPLMLFLWSTSCPLYGKLDKKSAHSAKSAAPTVSIRLF